ncbi:MULTISPECIES: hypothetical protein [unclassified Streptomyces]|uniref:hypothetical protein n=1 Tax=unclassified Streptomyces TaxID=2593676 RepID=UPI003251E3C7
MTASTSLRHNKSILLGLIALLVFTATAIGAGRWWDQHNAPSQASKADCALAQKIIDETAELPTDKTAVEKWEKTEQQRRAQLKDGYLGASISNYNGLAAMQAKGEATPPLKKRVQELADQANSHCSDADVKLVFPALAS